jgi:hypothetical protein
LRSVDDIDAEFAAAAAAAPGRPLVHLIEASKTGLRAPQVVPPGVDVVVDACQGRLSATRLRDYLSRGWPVLLTGSKFYGGPPFCGAVLFPLDRLAAIDLDSLPRGLTAYCHDMESTQPAANPGTVLRWAAALDEIQSFTSGDPSDLLARMRLLAERLETWLASTPNLVPLSIPDDGGTDAWPRSILTFAVRDSAAPGRLLALPQLRKLYRELASDGVLVGQPVGIGASYGGLRIAIGAPMLRDPLIEPRLQRLFSSLQRRTRFR